MGRDPPVEAVAAEVHQPAAPLEVGRQRVHRPEALVLGVRRGQDDLVRGEQLETLGVEVLVGDHVVAVAHLLQPVEEVEIGGQVADAGSPRVHVGQEARSEVQDGPETRGVGDPAPVAVVVVGGEPVVLVLVARPRARPPGRHARPVLVVGDASRDVRVHDIGEGGHQHADVGCRPSAPRADEERDHVLDVARAQAHRVHAAPEPVRHGVREVGGPPAVVEVVVVEVDGAVLTGRVAPAGLLARPARAHHGARREVHQLPVKPARPHVHRASAGGLPAEVPGRHQVAAGGAVRRGSDGRLREGDVVERGPLDLTVVVTAHRGRRPARRPAAGCRCRAPA